MQTRYVDPLADQRQQRKVVAVCRLGPRVVHEMLNELAFRIGGRPALDAVLTEYAALSPAKVKVAGGDRFPPRSLHVVPR